MKELMKEVDLHYDTLSRVASELGDISVALSKCGNHDLSKKLGDLEFMVTKSIYGIRKSVSAEVDRGYKEAMNNVAHTLKVLVPHDSNVDDKK